MEKFWDGSMDLYQVLVDFQQAYDSIDRRMIGKILRGFQIPDKLVRLVQITMTDTLSCVDIQGERGEFFQIRQGLKQGDGLAHYSLT